MGMIWLIVLLIYGAVQGFAAVPGLAWLLLIPLFFQDVWDVNGKKFKAGAIAFLLIGLTGGSGYGQQPGIPSNHYLLSSVSVYDGDTITADVHLGFSVVLHDQRVRLMGFDAWELTRARRTVEITDEELVKGRKARDALQELLGGGAAYLVPEARGKDPYGRLLGRLIVGTADGPLDVAEQMRRDGHDRDHHPPDPHEPTWNPKQFGN
jgi:endonuclease YncB( thermonuclease family)